MPENLTVEAPDDSDVALMGRFIQEHGAPPAEEKPSPKAPEPPEPPEAREEEEDEHLDPKTLEALGLLEGEENPPPSEEGDTKQTGGDLTSLAATLGLDPEDLSFADGKVMLRTKVDGEEATVPLQELRKGYQLQKHFTRQQEAFLAEKKAWEEAQAQRAQTLQNQEQFAAEILSAEEQKLNQEYTKDWNALRQEDPAEYAAQVAEYNQKLQRIRQRQQELTARVQQRQQEQAQQWQQRSVEEGQKLLSAFGWEPETVQPHAERLRKYLVETVGVTPEEIQATVDHRSFVLAEKARRYDELMRRVDLSKRKVKEAPQMPKGSAAQPESGESTRLKAAKARLGREHTTEAAAEVFKHLKVV